MIFSFNYINNLFVPPLEHNRGVKQLISNQLHSTIFMGYGPEGSAPFPDWFGTDPIKNQQIIEDFRNIGGEEFMLETLVGDKLHVVYLDASQFETNLAEMIKPDRGKFILKKEKEIPGHLKKIRQSIKSLHINDILSSYPIDYYKALPLRGPDSSPTVILCGGSGVWFSVYSPLVAKLLMSGMNVMAFNFRGYEKSEGLPTDEKLMEDVECCYHYLKQRHHIEDQDVLVYGSCLGAGPASELAKNYPGINLFIDRSFSEFRNVVRDQIKDRKYLSLITPLVHKIMPAIVNFNVGKNLEQVKGHIGVMVSTNEDFLEQEETESVLTHLPESPGHLSISLTSHKGHAGNWLNPQEKVNQNAISAFDQFLIAANLKRQPNFAYQRF